MLAVMTTIERIAIRIAVFLGGAILMSLEVSAFRMIGKTFGSALRETTAVIAVFLTAMSIGYWAGGRVGDHWPSTRTLLAALLAASATLLSVPFLDSVVSPRVASSSLELAVHAFAVTSFVFAIPTFLLSMISPIAVRLFSTSTSQSGATAGSISAISTLGSIAGSIATAFFIIDWLSSMTRTVLLLASLACATAVIVLLGSILGVVSRRERASGFTYALLVAAAMLSIVVAGSAFDRGTRLVPSASAAPGWRSLFSEDSAYHRVTVSERNVDQRRILVFNSAIQSRMDVKDPSGAGNPYTDSFHLSKLIRPKIQRVLLIGLGGGTAPKQFLRYYPDVVIDVVEIDPLVADVAGRFFSVKQDERLRIHIGDGRTFLKRSRDKWDLILIDAYTTSRYGDTIPAHLATREFFSEAAERLTDGGILHFHCAFDDSRLVPALEKTIGSVFDSVLVSGGEILASRVPLLTSREVIVERAGASAVAHLPNLVSYIQTLESKSSWDGDVPLLTDDYAPVDRLIRE